MAKKLRKKFDQDNVDGGLNSAPVETDEQFVIAMLYVADCYTYGHLNVDFEYFNMERERNKILDLLLMVADLE